jgi:hypothetical protein
MTDDPDLAQPWVSPADLRESMKQLKKTYNRQVIAGVTVEMLLEDIKRHRQLVELMEKQQRWRQLG